MASAKSKQKIKYGHASLEKHKKEIKKEKHEKEVKKASKKMNEEDVDILK